MKKTIILTVVFLFSFAAFSQESKDTSFQQSKHEFSVWGSFGLSTFRYDLSYGDRDCKSGFMFGLGYTYFFNYHWGLGIGAELSLLRTSLDISNFTDAYYIQAFNGADRPLYLSVQGMDYEESYKAFYINIPLMAKYQLDVWKQHKFYATGGFKLGIPVSGSYSTNGSYRAVGYDIDDSGNPIGDAMVGFHDLGKTINADQKGMDYDFGVNFILALEAGMKWKLTDQLSLYTGAFVDFGLVNVRKGDNDLRVGDYIPKDANSYDQQTNPVLNSVYGMDSKEYTDNVKTFSAGLKVQLAFGMKPFVQRKDKEGETPVEKPYEGLTAEQMKQIMDENTKALKDAIDKNFDELYKKLAKESPEFFEPIPTDEIEAMVQFDFDKENLKGIYFPDVDYKINIMKKYPEAKLVLVGHTDNKGTDEYNYQLGLLRAQAVKNYMVEHGIAPSRLSVESKGSTEPRVPNTTEENCYKNRRVEFILAK